MFMKRIKVMLLSLFVLAAVGGVLAFKAKLPNVCLYNIVDTTCPILITPSTVVVTDEGGVLNAYFQPRTTPFCPPTVDPTLCTSQLTYTLNE